MAVPTPPESPPLVAIVDDDDGVRRALRRLVASLGLRTATHASGEAFLDSAAGSPPACVLLDLNLPGLRGIEVLERLTASGRAVPVIVITGLDRAGLREQCLDAGAVAYLTKPIGATELAAALAGALGLAG